MTSAFRSWFAARPVLRATALALFGAVSLTAFGCSDQTPRPPRAIIEATLGPGEAGVTKCGISQNDAPWVTVGQPGQPVETGAEFNGAPISVECSVIPGDQAFDVRAKVDVTRAGDASGSISIIGSFPQDRNAPITVQATFSKREGNLVQQDCTVTYETRDQGVAAGRVWGVLKCPHMIDNAKSYDCEGKAEFKFENCVQ